MSVHARIVFCNDASCKNVEFLKAPSHVNCDLDKLKCLPLEGYQLAKLRSAAKTTIQVPTQGGAFSKTLGLRGVVSL